MADSYTPAYGLGSTNTKVAAAYIVTGTLDAWFMQPFLPVANNDMGRWLMNDAGYVEPKDRMRPGRQYP